MFFMIIYRLRRYLNKSGHMRTGVAVRTARFQVATLTARWHRTPPTERGRENLRRFYDRGTAFIADAAPGVFEQVDACFPFGAFIAGQTLVLQSYRETLYRVAV